MKFFFFLTLMVMVFNAIAASERLGLGVMLGNPTGLNGKYWLNGKEALDGGLGLSPGKRTEGNLHSDYLRHNKAAFYFNDAHPLDLYYGIGARMEFSDSIELGARLPVGVVHEVEGQAADIFAEVVPTLDFVGKTGLELGFAIGARYYFK